MPSVPWNLAMTHIYFVKTNAPSHMQHSEQQEIGITWIMSSQVAIEFKYKSRVTTGIVNTLLS